MKHKPGHTRAPETTPAIMAPAVQSSRSRLKNIMRRMLIVFMTPVLLLTLLETGLRLSGVGQATAYFIPSPDGAHWVSNPRFSLPWLGRLRGRPVIPAVLPRRKPPGTYRIFVIGESAARGEPNPAFSFARILEVMLRETFPDVPFEIVNTGVTAINSHALLQIVRDCARLHPDLFIVYAGNNEVIGPYSTVGAGPDDMPSLMNIRMRIRLQSTRIGQLPALWSHSSPTNSGWGGMQMFIDNQVSSDDPRLPRVYSRFRQNLEAICRIARRSGARVVLSSVATNLKDCPPFRSAHRKGIPEDALARWDEFLQQGIAALAAGKPESALESFAAAAGIDDQFAGLHFHMARAHLSAGRPDEARKQFVLARDLDTLRFRADTMINHTIQAVADEWAADGVRFLDAERAFIPASGQPAIPGADMFFEHVHLRFEGNYVLAAALYPLLLDGLPGPGGARARHALPPDAARCAERLAFTLFDRCAQATDILKITSHPPFPPEKARQDAAELKHLEAAMNPRLMNSILALCHRRVREDPDDLFLHGNLGNLEFFLGRFEQAENEFRFILGRCPNPHSRYWLGRSLVALNRFEESIPEFQHVLTDSPGHVEARAALAAVMHRLGRLPEAINGYEQVLALKPGDPFIMQALQKARNPAAAP